MSMAPELKFWGKDIEVKPKGHVIIEIPKYESFVLGNCQHVLWTMYDYLFFTTIRERLPMDYAI